MALRGQRLALVIVVDVYAALVISSSPVDGPTLALVINGAIEV